MYRHVMKLIFLVVLNKNFSGFGGSNGSMLLSFWLMAIAESSRADMVTLEVKHEK